MTNNNNKWKVKGFLQSAIVIFFIFASFFISNQLKTKKQLPHQKQSQNIALTANILTINSSDYDINFTTTGVVKARSEIDIVPQVSGELISISDSFFTGGFFYENQLLFEIEPIDYKLEIERLQAEVIKNKAAYILEKAQADAAISGWKQINDNEPPSELVARHPQKNEAEGNLKAAKAKLQKAKLDLERTKFSLPFNGYVLSSKVEKGQYVIKGQSYGKVYNSNKLEVQASLDDKKIDYLVDIKNPNILISTSYRGKKKDYIGVLKRGVSEIDPTTRFAKINIGFLEPPDKLVPGVFVDINIQGPRLKDVFVIPLSAMQKGSLLWGVDEQNKIYAIKEEIIHIDKDHVILRGLKENTRIIVSKLPGATPKLTVKPVDVKN